jgi:PAS domain S-box-containing protein
MTDEGKTQVHERHEVAALRQRIAELEALEAERTRVETALRYSEERYRVLYEDNPSMYFTVDTEGIVLSVNQFGAEQLGYTVSELVGQSVLNVFHQDDTEAVLQQLNACVQNPRQVFHWEFRKIRKDGSLMWVKEVARAVRGSDDRVVALIVCEDITERKLAEEALRRAHDELERRVQERTAALHESREHFRRLVETVNVIPWEADLATWRFTYVGPQAVGILGYPVEQWYEDDFWVNQIHPEDRDYTVNFCREASSHKEDFDFEYRMLGADGRVVWLRDLVTVVSGESGSRSLRGFMLDITERKRLEREILDVSAREQQRIGQDLHDGLGQHLTGIAFLSKVLEQKLVAKSLGEATEAAEIAALVNQAITHTRDLARGLCPVQLEASGLVAALQELASNAESLFNVSCRFECQHSVLIHDNAVATHLYYIGQEAISNAVKHGKARHIKVGLAAKNDRITLTVKDDGIGFPDVLENHGGMGLHIMNYRARMIDASLAIQRDPSGGTTVTCSLQDPKVLE